jgi:hypothetical protein
VLKNRHGCRVLGRTNYDDVYTEVGMKTNDIDRIINNLSEEIANDIDREVLWGMLKDIGWHRVMVSRDTDNKHAVDITIWLKNNVKNPYERRGRDFIFSAEKDAVKFILTWL